MSAHAAQVVLDHNSPRTPIAPVKEQPNRLRGFIAGVTSGVTKLLVGHPFDTVKVRLQTSGKDGRFGGPIDCLRQTIRKGNDPTIKLTILQHAIAGAGAGWTVSFIASPIEHIKSRLQVQYDSATKLYSGPIDCARKLIRNNGIQGLWMGLSGTLALRSFFFVMWGSYEVG
ncbi:15959_t:CDS:2 [Acaulospora colombiana]|uniref:15959_t:CDS:1 n=1 Tax=Acaulospora colombiana TaxID=27376 RepID=A0ACA9LC32_9GLOM|nr:15959_t:CDS:2 [Acaulospora colombiana]